MTEAYKILNEMNMIPDLVRNITGYLGPDPEQIKWIRIFTIREMKVRRKLAQIEEKCASIQINEGKYMGKLLSEVLDDHEYIENLYETEYDDDVSWNTWELLHYASLYYECRRELDYILYGD